MVREAVKLDYKGREVEYQEPLGIYLDGLLTGRVHDDIIPKYMSVSPDKLVLLSEVDLMKVRDVASRQLEGIARRDTEEIRISLQNTLDLTNSMLNIKTN